ncbi:MAG TPA: LysM peptidoglycan-binding domain-containing protein [Pyrinomonadaceae bacterium]
MKHENYKTATNQFHGKSHNEDWASDWPTRKGHLFFVIDFAGFSYTPLMLALQQTLEETVLALDKLPGLSKESFLGHIAKDLNNFVYAFGRDNYDGKLFCVVAMALLHGNNFYFLTYGDSRINIFTGDELLLLNGAKYQTRSVITDTRDIPPVVRENPEQMGRGLFEAALTERVRSFILNDDDVVLMYTDGLEENVTPQRRLGELRTLGKADPQVICDAMLKISDAIDDRTITVIGGPYAPLPGPSIEYVDKILYEVDKRLAGVEIACSRQTEVSIQLDSALSALHSDYVSRSEWSNLTKQLSSDRSADKIVSLEQKLEGIEKKNSKGKGRGVEGPFVLTLDQTVYETIREIVSAETGKYLKPDESVSIDKDDRSKKEGNYSKSEPGRLSSRVLSNPKVVMLSIFLFGMLTLWLLQVLQKKFWPERWIARTEAESLVMRRDDYTSSGVGFSVRLQPPVPYLNQTGSFEELVSHIARLQQNAEPRPAPASSPNRNESSAVPTETVQVVPALPGDSLNKMATRFKITEAKLKDLNPNINWDKLHEGEQVQVPSANVNPRNP